MARAGFVLVGPGAADQECTGQAEPVGGCKGLREQMDNLHLL